MEQQIEQAESVQDQQEAALTMEAVQKMLDEQALRLKETMQEEQEADRRKWQSKIDQLISEKTAVSKEKETTEERLARIEQEREMERLSIARKEAKYQAGLDDDFFDAALALGTGDVEKITGGALELKKWLDSKIEELAVQKYEKMVAEKYGKGKAPVKSTEKAAMPNGLDEAMRLAKENPDAWSSLMAAQGDFAAKQQLSIMKSRRR